MNTTESVTEELKAQNQLEWLVRWMIGLSIYVIPLINPLNHERLHNTLASEFLIKNNILLRFRLYIFRKILYYIYSSLQFFRFSLSCIKNDTRPSFYIIWYRRSMDWLFINHVSSLYSLGLIRTLREIEIKKISLRCSCYWKKFLCQSQSSHIRSYGKEARAS